MSKILMIVESPSKAKTFRKYLGSGFDVDSSMGHIRDLPTKEMGFDTETLRPTYVVSSDKKQVVGRLVKKAKAASKVLLATDMDREGEAIAWHLKQALKLKNKPYARISFNSVTKAAILKAIENEQDIDMKMVAAQETRRLLDRFVGYTVSPWLTNTLKGNGGLSGGRVQSVALRLVVERQQAIESFIPEGYYVISVELDSAGTKWSAELDPSSVIRESLQPVKETSNVPAGHLTNAHIAESISDFLLEKGYLNIVDIEEKETKTSPPAPFTTSDLQQAASNALNFSPKLTMSVAQALYEAGKITYMRTDTKNISEEAIEDVRNWIQAYTSKKGLSPDYLPSKPNRWTSGDNAQEAHEAIRPVNVFDLGKDIEGRTQQDTERMQALYRLIWKRTVACQMAPAIFDKKVITLHSVSDPDNGQPYRLKATGRTLKFKGWKLLMAEDPTAKDDDPNKAEQKDQVLPDVAINDQPKVVNSNPAKKQTKPPAFFNEASLVKALEKAGVGRPSTFAATLDRLFQKRYIVKGKGKKAPLEATELGSEVVSRMVGTFSFMEIDYTKRMEDDLDKIADGKIAVRDVLSREIRTLTGELEKIGGLEMSKNFEKKLTIVKDTCPECEKGQVVVRDGKQGPFAGCTNYPKCSHTEQLE